MLKGRGPRSLAELCDLPLVRERYAVHRRRLGLKPALPKPDDIELEAMLCDELGELGAFRPST